MRRVALVSNGEEGVRRVIQFATGDGVYLFLSRSDEDRGSFADEWYATVQDAAEECLKRFGIKESDWRTVPDPKPFCQHDWIAPVRVKGRADGRPEWGQLERFVDGKWVDLKDDPE